jgi:hypothetical protein
MKKDKQRFARNPKGLRMERKKDRSKMMKYQKKKRRV